MSGGLQARILLLSVHSCRCLLVIVLVFLADFLLPGDRGADFIGIARQVQGTLLATTADIKH